MYFLMYGVWVSNCLGFLGVGVWSGFGVRVCVGCRV